MSETIVLYSSRYGAARQYARMAAEELGCVARDLKDVRSGASGDIVEAARIILCGGIYAGGLSGISWIRKNSAALADKKVVLCAVGASPWDERAVGQLRERNLKGLPGNIVLFYGRGAWDESAMSFKDRTLCRMLQKAVAKKDPATCEPWEAALLEAAGRSCSWIDRKYLEQVYEYLSTP